MPSNFQLDLNPGPPPRRKSISGCKCILLTLFGSISLAIALFISSLVINGAQSLLKPHAGLYHSASLGALKPSQRASVVRPLFDHSNEFDIAVTVWLRTEGRHGDEVGGVEGGHEGGQLVERPLFSDVVFQKMRLTDKNVFANISFTVPTAIFRHANLSNYDLRASVMLLPSSPSLLDAATGFSSWIPSSLNMLPVRTWPFPLGSPEHRDKILADQILESFGVSFPLIQFHGTRSRCPTKNAQAFSGSEGFDEFEDDVENTEVDLFNTDGRSLITTDSQPVLKAHPYIITRTQIRIVDETTLFNRRNFTKAHKELRASSCGQRRPVASPRKPSPGRYSCVKNYWENGQWETQVELQMRDETPGAVHTELAYGPYITASKFGFGQRDLLPIPVNREDCKVSSGVNETLNKVPEQDSIEVSWQLSYSGRTPAKIALAEIVEHYKYYTFTDDEEKQVKQQGNTEITNGLLGHKSSPDAHPRRRFGLSVAQFILSGTAIILDISYWFTCKSTVSISILGTGLVASAAIAGTMIGVATEARKKDYTVPGWIATISVNVLIHLLARLLSIKAVSRADFHWRNNTGWIPVVRITPASLREKQSEKLEARTSWGAKAVLFLSILFVYYLKSPRHHHLIPSVFPSKPGDGDEHGFTSDFLEAMIATGRILQLFLNYTSGHYAGNYKLTAVLNVIINALSLADFVPAVVGRFESRRALPAQEVLEFMLLFVAAAQALSLPSVPQESKDEHID